MIVYVHDSSDTNSFSYISNLRVSVLGSIRLILDDLIVDHQQQYNLDHIPTLFVATKSDLDLAQQVRNKMDQYPPSDERSATRGSTGCVLQTVGTAGSGGGEYEKEPTGGCIPCHLWNSDQTVCLHPSDSVVGEG